VITSRIVRALRLFTALVVFGVFVVPTIAVRAQAIRGVVTMPDGTTRAAGVIVAAAGDTGALVRALTNQRGAFMIRLPAPGRYTLKALRVGFRPSDGPTVTVANNDTVEVQIHLTGVAVSLQAVTVRGDDVCRTRPDSGALVARAWEEARKAIMASQLAATDAPLVAEWVEYNRTLDPTGRIVRGLHVRSTNNPTTHAFRSVPAESLAARGYVVPNGDETTYHAPDGDALLSDSFAATHCFQIVPPGQPGQSGRGGADTLVGVAFRPARDRPNIRDIEGTFWLDRRTAELRWMDYSYTNMPSVADKASPGGRVEFLRLGTGGWLIGRWSIRMPEFDRAPATTVSVGRVGAVRAPATNVLRAIQVTGGQVTRVLRGDTVLYVGAGSALDVQVITRDPLVVANRSIVEIVGTGYSATANADGRARIAPVLEGRYELRVHTPLMDSLRVPPVTREVEVSLRARTDSVRLPSADEIFKTACKDSARAGESLVRGLVRDTLGNPLADVAVIVTWQGRFKAIGEVSGDRLQYTEQTVGSMTDDTGRWHACGVPREVLLVARVRMDKLSDARRLTLKPDQPLGGMDLVPHSVVATVDALIPQMNRAMVEFSVTDEAGAPLSGTTLDVITPEGITRTFNVGANGRALMPDAGTGRLSVRARKIGYRPGELVATIAAGRNTIPIIMSSADFPTLDTVRIIGDERRRGDRFDEFESRRLSGAATRSITRAEIVKRNPVEAWQMLTNVPSVKIATQGGQVIARSMRGEISTLLGPNANLPCYMRVMIDGVLMNMDIFTEDRNGMKSIPIGTSLNVLPPPDAIRGMEVFAGPASIPMQYGGAGASKWCGLIAVWTR